METMYGTTYVLIRKEAPRMHNGRRSNELFQGILCLRCKRVSYNPSDVENLYCGHCHEFHRPDGGVTHITDRLDRPSLTRSLDPEERAAAVRRMINEPSA